MPRQDAHSEETPSCSWSHNGGMDHNGVDGGLLLLLFWVDGREGEEGVGLGEQLYVILRVS